MEEQINKDLVFLESLMSEFFAPSTNNLRKREIESVLENFSNRSDSWRHCLIFLQKSQNQYVIMYTLTTLEKIINKKWIILNDQEKTEMRQTLWNQLLSQHETMPYFVRNKLAALIVFIARYDWPHLYPDFFGNIIELIESESRRALLGLILAQAASEELGGVNASSRTAVLLPSARRIELERLMLRGTPRLLQALTGILDRNAQKESNPPPSPTGIVPDMLALPDLLANTEAVATPEKALEMELVVKCLTTLQHLFSWLPLSSHVPPSLVTTVFYWGSLASQSQSVVAAEHGLGGVCELLYRRYAPPSAAATALRLQHCALRLAAHLTRHPQHMQTAPAPYLNKFAEFLKLFVSLHFKRLETEPEFDAIEFLSYLFQFTFQVPTCTTFLNCLEIWIQFMDVLKPEDTVKYWEPLQALVNGLLNKMMFQHNKAQLQHLDDETRDDDGETEWQSFLKNCIECIARVAELAPLDVFTLVCDRWQGLAGVYARAAGRGTPPGDADRLLAALLDLATLTRALGRLAPAVLSEEGPRRSSACAAGAALVERVAATLTAAANTSSHMRTRPEDNVLAEMFACMSAWACYTTACSVPPNTTDMLLSATLPFLLPHQVSPILSHAAARMLNSLATNGKFSSDPLQLVTELHAQALRSLQHLEPKTAEIVRVGLFTIGARGPGTAARALLAAWGASFSTAPATTLPPLTALVHHAATAGTATKRILAEGLMDIAVLSLELLRLGAGCAGYGADAELSDFCLALFSHLLHQLGSLPDAAIDVFVRVAERGGSDSGMERVVECMRLAIEAGDGGAHVTPVMRLVTSHALPFAHHTDVSRALHRLLDSLLLHRFRYFFPQNVSPAEEKRRLQQLGVILYEMLQAISYGEVEVLRPHLSTLDTLNTRWRLYHKEVFRTEFLWKFLASLMCGALERSGARALLRDELVVTIHALANVDFQAFRDHFLRDYLRALPGLPPDAPTDFPPDTDLPTFTQNIDRLLNDVYCYREYHDVKQYYQHNMHYQPNGQIDC